MDCTIEEVGQRRVEAQLRSVNGRTPPMLVPEATETLRLLNLRTTALESHATYGDLL